MSTERDPPRWSQGGEGVPAGLSQALGAARGRLPGDSVLSAVAARLPSGPPGGSDGGPGAWSGGGGAPAAAMPSIWSGVLIGAALGALVGGVSLLVPAPTSDPAMRPAAIASSSKTLALPASSIPLAPPVDATASPVGSTAASPPAGSPSMAGSSSMASSAKVMGAPDENVSESEVDYLRRAHAQIGASPAQALALAEGHPGKYPRGQLGQERELIAIGALGALGRKAEARARAQMFVTRFPGSAHQRRLAVLVPDLGEAEKIPEH